MGRRNWARRWPCSPRPVIVTGCRCRGRSRWPPRWRRRLRRANRHVGGSVQEPGAQRSVRDPFPGPEMHTGHEPSSSGGSPSDRGDPIAFRCCFTALKGQHTFAWGNAPGKPGQEDRSPEGANHGRILDRRPGFRLAAYRVRSVCRTYANRAPLPGSGSPRCLPGALPQANVCCPVGAKSTAGQPLSHIKPGCFMNVRREAVEGASWCGSRTVWR